MKTRCGHETRNGEPCKSDFGLCDECGHCFQHCEHRAEEAAEARKKGGRATAQHFTAARLAPGELPPLVSHEAAEVWADVIGRAVATSRMTSNAANAALRAIKEWRESHDAGEVSDRLEEIMEALDEWKQSGSPDRLLELVP